MPEEYGNGRDQNGKFLQGNKLAEGRGQNKVSTKVREAVVNFLESNLERIQADFDTLKPRERLQFFAEILPYAAPKLSSIQTEINAQHSGGITVRWEDPDPRPDKGTNGILQSLPEGVQDNS